MFLMAYMCIFVAVHFICHTFLCFLYSDRCLLDYEYTHNCIKLNIPVNLVLVERSLVKQVMSRTVSEYKCNLATCLNV